VSRARAAVRVGVVGGPVTAAASMNRIVATSATSAAAGWLRRSRMTTRRSADRDVHGRRVRGARARPVEEVLERPDRSEEGPSQRWLKSPRGVPSVLCGDEACDETTHSNLPG
jgi:hypothetical protein